MAIQCLDQAAAALAGAFQTYGDALSRVNYPSSATVQAQAAEAAARQASARAQRPRPVVGNRRLRGHGAEPGIRGLAPGRRRHVQRVGHRARGLTRAGPDRAADGGRTPCGSPPRPAVRCAAMDLTRRTLVKVPEITALFWITKLLTTAMGESTSDYFVNAVSPVLAVAVGHPRAARRRGLPVAPGPVHPLGVLAGGPPGGDRRHHGGRRAPQAVRGPLRRVDGLLRRRAGRGVPGLEPGRGDAVDPQHRHRAPRALLLGRRHGHVRHGYRRSATTPPRRSTSGTWRRRVCSPV